MLKHVHHIHYLVHDRDVMVDYLDKNFGMKPDQLFEDKQNNRKEAIYKVDKTQLQIVEPLDATSVQGRHLAQHGPGVYHVAWAIDNLRTVVPELIAKGNKLKFNEELANTDILKSPRGYPNCNIDPASSHGLWFQLVGED
jgi:methylmalonyl-CoA/ethylmalonyl-CoA epimerase